MTPGTETHLSRRERQIMDIVYTNGQASVAEVCQAITDPPSYSAIRALMRILEDKGHLNHKVEGNKYVYLPTRSRKEASKTATRRLLKTFFDGSMEQALAALLEVSQSRHTQEELDRLTSLISKARKEGR